MISLSGKSYLIGWQRTPNSSTLNASTFVFLLCMKITLGLNLLGRNLKHLLRLCLVPRKFEGKCKGKKIQRKSKRKEKVKENKKID